MRKILKKKSKNAEKPTASTSANGNNNTNTQDDSEEESYEVEKIVDSKIEKDVCYYLIRWKGYSANDDTWEAKEKIDAPEAIAAFEKLKKTKKQITPKKKTDSADRKRKSSGPVKDEKEWEVEKIIDMVEKDEETGERLFRIRWKGYAARNDTWEPESNLNCEALIHKFLITEKNRSTERKDLRDNRKTTERYAPNNLTGRASRRQHGKIRKVYYDAE